MKKYIYAIFLFFSLCLLSGLLSACGKSEPEPPVPDPGPLKRVLLLYAVASNNLYGNCLDDLREMEQGASSVNLDEYAVVAYVVAPGAETASLRELKRNPYGSCSFTVVREYDRETYSTDPSRLRRVIDDVEALLPAEKYGLVLWSHGTGWSHEEVVHPESPDVNRAFGMDKYDGQTDYMNIDELASAIPSGRFDYIWFDACYMGGIETVYQLRDKCDYFVGYPTEVWSPGMPYHLTLPLLLKSEPNLLGAAELFADYYEGRDESYTIAVLRTDGLDRLAEAARSIYAGAVAPDADTLLKYSRSPCGPFYDFRQFTLGFTDNPLSLEDSQESEESEISDDSENLDNPGASGNNDSAEMSANKARFSEILEGLTIYKRASAFNFLYPGYGPMREEYLIPEADFSGINCHWFRSPSSEEDFPAYYRTLDWYRDAIAPTTP